MRCLDEKFALASLRLRHRHQRTVDDLATRYDEKGTSDDTRNDQHNRQAFQPPHRRSDVREGKYARGNVSVLLVIRQITVRIHRHFVMCARLFRIVVGICHENPGSPLPCHISQLYALWSHAVRSGLAIGDCGPYELCDIPFIPRAIATIIPREHVSRRHGERHRAILKHHDRKRRVNWTSHLHVAIRSRCTRTVLGKWPCIRLFSFIRGLKRPEHLILRDRFGGDQVLCLMCLHAHIRKLRVIHFASGQGARHPRSSKGYHEHAACENR